MIGAVVAVGRDGAAELGHADDHRALPARPQRLRHRIEARGQPGEILREPPGLGALVHVRVPAEHVERGDARAVIGREQLARDLGERREPVGAIAALHVHRRIGAQHLVGKSLRRQPALERGAEQRVVAIERAQRHDEVGRRLRQLVRLPRCDRDLAPQDERHGAADGEAGAPIDALHLRERAIEPAVARAPFRREPALHQILRIEMRARDVAVAGRRNEQELATLVIGRERRQRRMEAERVVERDDAAVRARRLQGDRPRFSA